MTKIQMNVVAHMDEVIRFNRYAQKNQPAIMETAAKRLLKYEKDRFLRLSRSGGSSVWPALSDITERIKEARGYTKYPAFILREKDELRNSMGMQIIRNRWYVGFVTNKGHWRYEGGTRGLAAIHHYGEGNVPKRTVIGVPPLYVKKNMASDIRREFKKGKWKK